MQNFFTLVAEKSKFVLPSIPTISLKKKLMPLLVYLPRLEKIFFTKIYKNHDIKIVLAVFMYFLAAQAGLLISFEESKASALWPPSGMAFSLLILFGYRIWPAITIGSLVANFLMFIHKGILIDLSMITASSIIAVGNTLEGLLGYILLTKLVKRKSPFTKTMDTFVFLFIVLFMSLVGAAFQNLGLLSSPISEEIYMLPQFIANYLSSAVSILVITPFVLSITGSLRFNFPLKKLLELFSFGAFLAFFIMLLKVEYIAPSITQSFPFLIIPFLLWLAFRFDLKISSLGIMMVSFIAISITLGKHGPFAVEQEIQSMFSLQIFMAIISITTLILHATVTERHAAQNELLEFNEKLEIAVLERTSELKEEIKERKKVEQQMKAYNESLIKTNHELDNFVYRVSHDLRAPIASILGLTHLTKLEDKLPMVRQQIEMIENSAEKLDVFIKDILDLSRNSRLEPAKEEINFEEMIEEIFKNLQYSSQNSGIVKNIDIQQDEAFYSDSMRLKVIFNNLISNAIRYSSSENPSIDISVKIQNKQAEIIVADNGIGIEEEHIPHIFNMFYRATEKNTGSGLGLYIVKESVEKLKGSVSIKSKPGEGTRVCLKV